jgi:hypothetical protein
MYPKDVELVHIEGGLGIALDLLERRAHRAATVAFQRVEDRDPRLPSCTGLRRAVRR